MLGYCGSSSGFLQANGYVFDVEELVQAPMATLAPDAAVLDTTKRCLGGGRHAIVYPDNAIFECLGYAVRAAQVVGVNIGRQPIGCIVGVRDGLVFGVKHNNGCDGSEGFFFEDLHARLDACQHGGLIEEIRGVAANLDFSALVEGILDVALDFLESAGIDQWADFGGGVGRVAHLEATHSVNQLLGEGVGNVFLDVDAVGADAGLAGIAEF